MQVSTVQTDVLYCTRLFYTGCEKKITGHEHNSFQICKAVSGVQH